MSNNAMKPSDIQKNNIRQILKYFQVHHQATITEVALVLGVTRRTISKAFEKLLDCNLIVSLGKKDSPSQGGKRPELYGFNVDYQFLNILVNWNTVILKITNLNLKTTVTWTSSKVQLDNIDDLLTQVKKGLKEINCEPADISGVGVSLPGTTMKPNSGLLLVCACLKDEIGKDISIPIAKLFPKNKILIFYHDGKLVTKNQAFKQKIENEKENTLVLFTDQGIAGGLIENGKMVNNIGGGFGHIKVDTTIDTLCSCGMKGCLEVAAGRKAIVRWQEENPKFKELTFEQVFSRSDLNDEPCKQFSKKMAFYFYSALTTLLECFDVNKIAISGDYGNPSREFRDDLEDYRSKNKKVMFLWNDVEITYDAEPVVEQEVKGLTLLLSEELFKKYGY